MTIEIKNKGKAEYLALMKTLHTKKCKDFTDAEWQKLDIRY
jgi:hypothetical protein